ncbi:helix-turn-helix transcriptional regulator [Escherichia coli]|uniref:helix-turn-helix domain-containing protein n=1 Tax=Escherichia TaxID=561 RepID=UPI000931A5B7|nr:MULTISPECIES: helix-turn-helix transcriptional regulator [Escherichia]ELX0599233.1 helix-turn-helix transcriptional regulator [Salmonella enterica subsp. enterica serovar Infantis]UVY30615.1 MAG: helix-turn-helix domain protein [Bacteriophage sp.]EEW1773503.1 XRE family transcriptional regulator [Escherichia coli]EEX2758293.1 XRE family transcriptional regulator [Escherichia coli]EFA7467709.1 helix-turn-helix transcriptional regulator [Escherichia coli]
MTSIKHDRTFHNEQIVRFGERLEKAMGGLNKSEIARRSGLSEASVRKYLRGDSYPTIDSAARVADACGVSLMWLLTGEQPQGDNSNNYEKIESKFDCDDDSVALIVSLLGFVSSKDRKALAIAASEIGVKGILNRLATSVETDIETVIRNLNIRDSLKEAICVALAGNEETDKEILQRAKSCIRAGTPGDRVPITPEQETKPVNKKSA